MQENIKFSHEKDGKTLPLRVNESNERLTFSSDLLSENDTEIRMIIDLGDTSLIMNFPIKYEDKLYFLDNSKTTQGIISELEKLKVFLYDDTITNHRDWLNDNIETVSNGGYFIEKKINPPKMNTRPAILGVGLFALVLSGYSLHPKYSHDAQLVGISQEIFLDSNNWSPVVENGTFLKKGDIVAQLHSFVLEREIRDLRSNLRSLQETEVSLKGKIEIYNEFVSSTIIEKKKTLKVSQESVAKAIEEYNAANDHNERVKKAGLAYSSADKEVAENSVTIAQKNLNLERASSDLIRHRLNSAKNGIILANDFVDSTRNPKPELRIVQSEILAARQKLRLLQSQRNVKSTCDCYYFEAVSKGNNPTVLNLIQGKQLDSGENIPEIYAVFPVDKDDVVDFSNQTALVESYTEIKSQVDGGWTHKFEKLSGYQDLQNVGAGEVLMRVSVDETQYSKLGHMVEVTLPSKLWKLLF